MKVEIDMISITYMTRFVQLDEVLLNDSCHRQENGKNIKENEISGLMINCLN